ncbi:MAG TPA: tetratricopeptide repeat protein [Candidatus Competibacter sp.]|nr:tetratricopeptide repeat protein [Candidatus Competibacter sp.]
MAPPHFIAPVLAGLVFAGCTDRDRELAPVIPPLPAETVRRAKAGDAAAQFALADRCRALEQSKLMLHWLRESAERGYPLAQTSLGVLYLNGDGVPLDRAEAYAWFALAAEQGEPDALEAAGALGVELSDAELARAGALASRHAAARWRDRRNRRPEGGPPAGAECRTPAPPAGGNPPRAIGRESEN